MGDYTRQLNIGEVTVKIIFNAQKWSWLWGFYKAIGKYWAEGIDILIGREWGERERKKETVSEVQRWRQRSIVVGFTFPKLLVSTACLQCKHTCGSGLCTYSHFREARGFLCSLHFSSGQSVTFWSSWLCMLHDWTQLCQTSLRKLTFVYFERKKKESESQLLPPALLIKRTVSQQERCCF